MQQLPASLSAYFLSQPVTCPAVQHHDIDPALVALLRRGFKLDHEVRVWTNPAALILLHTLTQGRPSFGFYLPDQAGAQSELQRAALQQLRQHHSDKQARSEVWVVDEPPCPILYLIPLPSKHSPGLPHDKLVLAYTCGRNDAHLLEKLVHSSKIPLIFDLDQTLLTAFTVNSLTKGLLELATELGREEAVRPGQAKALELRAAHHDCRRHLVMLQSFADSDSVHHEGQVLQASIKPLLTSVAAGAGIDRCAHGHSNGLEEAASPYDRAGRVQRPVIRLDDLTVFVRIEPHRRDTSMLFMLRPGWRSFWEALGGRPSSTPAGAAQGVKQRCDISICTAAELPYAYEAWRNLDPDFCLLPAQEARRRIITVGKGVKTLERALGMEQQLVLTARSPFAVVVDDRKEVWESKIQDHVLWIEPFQPFMDRAKTGQNRALLAAPLERVRDHIMNVRSHIYFHINIKLVPVVRSMLEDPWPAADFGPDRLGSLLPKPLHAPALIKESNLQPPKHPGLSSLPSNPFQLTTASSSTPAASGEDPACTAPMLPTQASVTSAAPMQTGPAQPSATSAAAPAEPGAGSATPFVRTGAPAVPAVAPPGPPSLKPAADPARDPRRAARAAAATKAPQQAPQEKQAPQQSELPKQPPAAEQSQPAPAQPQQAQQPWPLLELLKRNEAPKRPAEEVPRSSKHSSAREGLVPAAAPQDAQQQAQGSAASLPHHSPHTSQAAQEAGAGAQARLPGPPARSGPAAAADRPGQPPAQADAGLQSSTRPLGGGPSPAHSFGNGPAAAAHGNHPLQPAGAQEAARAETSLASAAHRLQVASDTPLPGPPSRPQHHSAQPLGGGPKFVDMTLTDSPEANPHHLPGYGALLPLAPQPLQHNPWNPPPKSPPSSKRSHASMGGSSPEHQGPAQRQRTFSSPQRPQASGVPNGSRANFAATNAVPRGFGGRQGASQPSRGSGSQQDGFGQPSAGAIVTTGLPPPPEHGAATSSSKRRKRGRQGSSDAGRGKGRGRGRQRS